MELRPKSASRRRTRGVEQGSTSKKDPIADLLPNLAGFIEDGDITVGIVHPVGCVATATHEHASVAILGRRKNETLTQLLMRLDYAIGLALTEDIFNDEIND